MDFFGGFGAAFGPFANQVHRSETQNNAPSPASPNPARAYKYDLLRVTRPGVTEFRLLEIESASHQLPIGVPLAPGPGFGIYGPTPPATRVPGSGQISVRLPHFPFDDTTPAFTALSYNWGDPMPKTAILCNNATFDAGPSLYAALVALRERHARMLSYPQQPRCLFWIDALCIDQDNDEEKAQQVPLINTRYRHAAHVLVWLGDPGANGALALPFLYLCASAADLIRYMPAASAHHLTDAAWAQLGFHMPQHERWRHTRALLAFLSQPWF